MLPSIRKTGGYIAGQESMEPADILARALRVAESIIAEKDARLSVAKPKADALVLVGYQSGIESGPLEQQADDNQ